MARKKSVQEIYKSELKKLEKRIQRQEQKGYIPNLNIKEKKRYTQKDIQKIKSIKAKQIKESAQEFVDIRTGEVLPVSEAKRIIQEQKQENEYKSEEYLPSFNYINAVEELIDNLPNSIMVYENKHYGEKDLTPDKAFLKSILWDTLAEADNEQAYNEYLSTVYGKIQDELTVMTYDSSGDAVAVALSNTIPLIANRTMTMGEAQMLADLSELI